MYNSQIQIKRNYARHQGSVRGLYREGTGSIIVEEQSDPFQSVPYLWTQLSSAIPDSREYHSATTGGFIVITKNQIDPTEAPSAMESNLDTASSPVVLSPALVLDTVRAVFGLNFSETAEVFGITGQTVSQWMKLTDMEQVRSPEDRDRIEQLYGTAQAWQTHPPLTGRWLHAHPPPGNTVLDLLKAPQLDLDALQATYQALAAETARRRREEGERATQAASALAGVFAGLGAGRKTRRRLI